MIDPSAVPDVAGNEDLARFIVHSRHVRRSNLTIRPDAFIPHPYPDLSVSRHLDATEEELWSIGLGIANVMGKTLYGRADILALTCLAQNLTVTAAPIAANPNHANISGWPADYDMQKAIALEIAATARYVDRP
jgi:hypothetical protein